MLPNAPYLLVGFTTAPGTPNGQQICDEIERDMPLPKNKVPIALPIADTFLIPCPKNDPDTPFQDISDFFQQRDAQLNGSLLWFVQCCRSNEISGL
jgi:hypothetical protein